MALCVAILHSRLPIFIGMPEYFQTLYIINSIGASAVPVFFFITGYLFFRNYENDMYLKKLKSRVSTLLVPYLLWNVISAIVWYVFGIHCITDNIRFDSLGDIISNILASKYSIVWFVGVLFIYALVAPLVYYMVKNKRVGIVSIAVTVIVALVFRHPFCSPLLWLPLYTTGAWIGMHYKNFMYEEMPVKFTLIGVVLFPIFFYLDQFHSNRFVMNMVHWTAPCVYIGIYDQLNKVFKFRTLEVFRYSFLVYCMHYIPIHVLQRYVILQSQSESSFWIAYTVIPICVLISILAISHLLCKKFPKIYAVLSGNR